MATWGKLLLAVDRRDVECVRSLLNEGKCRLSMQTKHGNTALHRAAKAGNREIVKLLLEAGAKPHATNHNGWTPLHDAAFAGHDACVELLTSVGADVAAQNIDGMSPLILAKRRGHEWRVKSAICSGLELASRPSKEVTPAQPSVQQPSRKTPEAKHPHLSVSEAEGRSSKGVTFVNLRLGVPQHNSRSGFSGNVPQSRPSKGTRRAPSKLGAELTS
eukprot:m.6215 g.6215  ORF g.6215 m.6215 type:complete len:217 (+) comp3809_c0_seq2:35-685(+)